MVPRSSPVARGNRWAAFVSSAFSEQEGQMHRKSAVLGVMVIFVVASCAGNAAAVWRMPGGPLVYRGPGLYTGLVIPATMPRGQTLYYRAPQVKGVEQPLIEHVQVVGATSGVEVLGIYVRGDEFAAAGDISIPGDNHKWVNPPARTVTFSCCEGEPELLIALRLTAPGEQRIDALSIDYRAGPWSYNTVLKLDSWPLPPGQPAAQP
jgi:hypothetical protein